MSDERDWWHRVPVDTIKERLSDMGDPQLCELRNDISSRLAAMGPQLTSPNGDPEWRQALRVAMGKTAEMGRLVRAELSLRGTAHATQSKQDKRAMIAKAREALARGDAVAAVAVLLDWYDPDLARVLASKAGG